MTLLCSHLEAVEVLTAADPRAQKRMHQKQKPSCLMATWDDVTESTMNWLLPCVYAHKHTAAADACSHLYCERLHSRHQSYLVLSRHNSHNRLRLHTICSQSQQESVSALLSALTLRPHTLLRARPPRKCF